MENILLSNTIESLLKTHLELSELRMNSNKNSGNLASVVYEKLSNNTNAIPNLLDFKYLQEIFIAENICSKIDNEIQIKTIALSCKATELAQLFPNILCHSDSCGITFSYLYNDTIFKIQIMREFQISEHSSDIDFDKIYIKIFNDVNSNDYDECIMLERNEINLISYNTNEKLREILIKTSLSANADVKSQIDLNELDKMFNEAARLIVQFQQGSASFLGRKLKLGFNRAERICDQLASNGIIGPFNGSSAREILINDMAVLEAKLSKINNK